MTTPSLINRSRQILASRDIRPSAQRVAILGYLLVNKTHPTADEIHQALLPRMPHLSLTTVYNTLRLMADHKAIRVLEMDHRQAHFDYAHTPHAHIWCRCCGRIADVELPALPTGPECDGFAIDETELYYKGLCPDCLRSDT